MNNRIPMTPQGVSQLRQLLEELKSKRSQISSAIAEARALGDLKENAEYHAAREKQSFHEGKIQDVEAKLSRVHIIDIGKIPHSGKVIFGTTVDLLNLENGEKVTYQIVGDDEADITQQKISVSAPIARAMIGRYEGDTMTVKTPSGETDYEILAVHHKEQHE
ncbi:MAG: transcription elongation factor GreA [Gammaproteobacteria bacterium]|nr:transcription elongation factor GreA [Gammaproteobacteria bacterium]